MAQVEVTIPRMLADLVRATRRFCVEGDRVADVLSEVTRLHPELAVHLFDEAHEVRPHVSIFHNGRQATLDATAADGDEVVILQAVSGGSCLGPTGWAKRRRT